ncbi:hypothetical protein J4E91_008050 [Alternaria rosae]|nr:hypothetical protein J4E91_008050 [Alternaria rosae]
MKFTAATTLLLATVALASPAPVANPDALEERASSGGKGGKGGKGGSGGNNTENAASDMLSPSRVLQITALSLGVVEIVRLWS